MAKKTDNSTIRNKRASFDYDLKQTFLAGIVLTGAETRSLREKHGSLQGAFVQLKNDEVWLVNSLATPLKTNIANLPPESQSRDRKLLLKKREIDQLAEAKKQGNTIIPIKFLTKGRFVKVEIAIARGKRKYDKRQSLKQRDQARDARRELKL
ncbi:SsrA-binding protein SmpB [Candidatus Saccharibacteria bacterium]|nr:SsrA-binding protein SmpB [Candidatus Saccharibacteria bacterium]